MHRPVRRSPRLGSGTMNPAADLPHPRAAAADPAADLAPPPAAADPAAPPHLPDAAVAFYPHPLPSAVTVLSRQGANTFAGSGFILSNNAADYTVVFCSGKPYRLTTGKQLESTLGQSAKYWVYFTDNTRKEAKVLKQNKCSKFLLLIVRESVARTSVTFSNEPLIPREVLRTVGTMAGTRRNPGTPVIDELLHVVGSYRGVVLAPSCASMDVLGNIQPGHENCFIVKCTFQDFFLELQNIDQDRVISVRTLYSAPVFRKNGDLVGIVLTENNYLDSVVALNVQGLLPMIYQLCNVKSGEALNLKGALLGAVQAFIRRNS